MSNRSVTETEQLMEAVREAQAQVAADLLDQMEQSKQRITMFRRRQMAQPARDRFAALLRG